MWEILWANFQRAFSIVIFEWFRNYFTSVQRKGEELKLGPCWGRLCLDQTVRWISERVKPSELNRFLRGVLCDKHELCLCEFLNVPVQLSRGVSDTRGHQETTVLVWEEARLEKYFGEGKLCRWSGVGQFVNQDLRWVTEEHYLGMKWNVGMMDLRAVVMVCDMEVQDGSTMSRPDTGTCWIGFVWAAITKVNNPQTPKSLIFNF